jgi:hypothetical protein
MREIGLPSADISGGRHEGWCGVCSIDVVASARARLTDA